MALGRGLSELLGEIETAYDNSTSKVVAKESIAKLDVNTIKPNPAQPRKVFDDEKLAELAESIKNHGLIQPISVLKEDDGSYTLISGERRLRAHKLANIETINAIVLDLDKLKLREVALIENIQRDDLNIIELAYSYATLINEHNITHDELSNRVSKSRSSITNTLRLLQLSTYVQELLGNDKLSAGHAKILVGLDEEYQKLICDTVIGQKLSVRETEKLVKELKTSPNDEKKEIKKAPEVDFSKLNESINFLKSQKFNVKLSKNILKIEITSDEDVEKLNSLLS